MGVEGNLGKTGRQTGVLETITEDGQITPETGAKLNAIVAGFRSKVPLFISACLIDSNRLSRQTIWRLNKRVCVSHGPCVLNTMSV